MSKKRVRLKKGTVIDERQDENGQRWRTTVVRDAATGFKSVTRKIDAPNREDSRSASQSDAPRKAPAKKTAPRKKLPR
jgi:hypothetical protein